MASADEKNQELQNALKGVIKVLEDSQKGMADLGEHVKEDGLKRFFLAESLKRANFRGELENELHRHGVHDVREGGTMTGALYRAWTGLKASLGGGDASLLASAEEAEQETRDAYQDALKEDLPLPLRQLLTEQQTEVLTARDFMRDARAKLKWEDKPSKLAS